MTLIVGWIARDARRPCSAYIASDSRISNGVQAYDFGQKTFALKQTPDILAYCGEVLFTSQTIGTLVSICDEGGILDHNMDCCERSVKLFQYLKNSHEKYKINKKSIKVFHIGRNHKSEFQVFVFSSDERGEWDFEEISHDIDKSTLVFCDGSGAKEYRKRFLQFKKGNNEDTSRNFYHCFCDLLENIEDCFCGGAPQLVGLYNGKKYNGMYYGTVFRDKKYYKGREFDESLLMEESIRWYNERFEICDPFSLQRADGAMIQPISKKATP